MFYSKNTKNLQQSLLTQNQGTKKVAICQPLKDFCRLLTNAYELTILSLFLFPAKYSQKPLKTYLPTF